jgi:hypothetical protein
MAEVDNLVLLGLVTNVVQVGRYIILGHIVEGKVPELAVLNGVLDMLVRVDSSSGVSDPNIIALVN